MFGLFVMVPCSIFRPKKLSTLPNNLHVLFAAFAQLSDAHSEASCVYDRLLLEEDQLLVWRHGVLLIDLPMYILQGRSIYSTQFFVTELE